MKNCLRVEIICVMRAWSRPSGLLDISAEYSARTLRLSDVHASGTGRPTRRYAGTEEHADSSTTSCEVHDPHLYRAARS